MDIDVLRRGFKLVEHIYDNQARDLELHRIKEVGNGLASAHWTSKQWLVDQIKPFISNQSIHIAAGWLGLTGYLLRKQLPDNNIICSDMDPGCAVMGKFLFENSNIQYDVLDTVLSIERIADTCEVYINTSIEHIHQEYVEHILSSLHKDTLFAFQSNNYFSVEDHINCSDDLQQFIDKTKCSEILYSGKMSFDNYDRYLIIGKI